MQGKVTWQSPSNIALVKYWGKTGSQMPRNPSLSMTLSKAVTETNISYTKVSGQQQVSLNFSFEGKSAPRFSDRVLSYLQRLSHELPWLSQLHLEIDSRNSFPHSSGIASSASAFSALALAISSLSAQINKEVKNPELFLNEASRLSRLGSGSACRSVYGGYVVWGKIHELDTYSDFYAVPVSSGVHPVFKDMQDAILLVNASAKKVGSSAGHKLMDTNPFATARYAQANRHVNEMLTVLADGDLSRFIEIAEQEALTLHALMMASTPGYVLMESGTLAIIDRVRRFREETKVPVCFTLDAGPNVHLLYPDGFRSDVMKLIKEELLSFCSAGQFLDDEIGQGPKQIPEME